MAEHDDFPLSLLADRVDSIIAIISKLRDHHPSIFSSVFGSLLSLVHTVLSCSEETVLTQHLIGSLYETFYYTLVEHLLFTLGLPHSEQDDDALVLSLEVCRCLTARRAEDLLTLAGGQGDEAAAVEILGVTFPKLRSLMGALELFLMREQVSEELDECVVELMETLRPILAFD